MQPGAKQGYDLARLKLDLSGLSDVEIEALGHEYYCERFLDNARNGVRETHDGDELYFWERRFKHACFIRPEELLIDKARVARLPWIMPLIEGKIADSEC